MKQTYPQILSTHFGRAAQEAIPCLFNNVETPKGVCRQFRH